MQTGLINDVNPSLLRTLFLALSGRKCKCNAARDATGLSIAKQTLALTLTDAPNHAQNPNPIPNPNQTEK